MRAAGQGKPVVAVLMNGRPLAVQWLADSTSALVESWYLGVEHGNALADVLFGDVAPSGKLPVTFPRVTGQVPIYYAHKNTGRPADPNNHYTSKYLDVPWTPLFPFGHGLSYTTFGYADLRPSSATIRAGDSVGVAVTVTNTGAREGTEVVQLYLRHDAASVTRPVRELKRFARVTLRPGESRTVRFTLARRRTWRSTTSTCGASSSRARSLCSPAAAPPRRSRRTSHLTDRPACVAPVPPRMH